MPDSMETPYDLLVTAGRMFCSRAALDGPGGVVVRNGRIVASGSGVGGEARRVLHFPDGILLPGLIDLHAHPARSGSIFGVDPDRYLLPRGVTTVLSQGDAGADNVEAFFHDTFVSSRTRVRLAINLSRIGESAPGGCFARLENADVAACVAAVQRHREAIWGIAVNAGHHACGHTDPRLVVRRGLEAAGRTGLPLLYGMRRMSDWPFADQLRQLRSGDIVTYCFRRQPHCIIREERVDPAMREARERGILFDVGHGTASFSFPVAESALRDDFPPDSISTDFQRSHLSTDTCHDLPLVMSKLRAAGMPEPDVFRAVTETAAKVLRLDQEIGSLVPGTCADLTVLRPHGTPQPLRDPDGEERTGIRWEACLTILNGRIVSCLEH